MRRPLLLLAPLAAFCLLPLAGCQDETPPPKAAPQSAEDRALADRVKNRPGKQEPEGGR